MHLKAFLPVIFLTAALHAADANQMLRTPGGDWPLATGAAPRFIETELLTPEAEARLGALNGFVAQAKWALANHLPERALAIISSAEKAPDLPADARGGLTACAAVAFQMAGQFQRAIALVGRIGATDADTQAWLGGLQARIRLADEVVAPLVRKLQADPKNADAWSQLAEAWTYDTLYSPRNALAAAAEALALEPENTRAKGAEEWAIAQYLYATPGRRQLARGEEVRLSLVYQPEYFPKGVRTRLLARLEQPLENSLVHWIRNVVRLSARGPEEQPRQAWDLNRTVETSLTDDPKFPSHNLTVLSAAVTAYATADRKERAELAELIEASAGREYFQPELDAFAVALKARAPGPVRGADDARAMLGEIEALGRVTVQAMDAGRRQGPNWRLLKPYLDEVLTDAAVTALTPAERSRLFTALAAIFDRQPAEVSALAAAAKIFATLARATPGADPNFVRRCHSQAKDAYSRLLRHPDVAWRELIAAALYARATGRTTEAEAIANRISDEPGATKLVHPDLPPAANAQAWLHAGLLHLHVQTGAAIAAEKAKACFAEAGRLCGPGVPEHDLVRAARAILAGTPDATLRKRVPLSDADQGLQTALRQRLLALEFLQATEALIGPLPSGRRLGWTSPSLDPGVYRRRLDDMTAELTRLPTAAWWRELERPNDGGFARKVAPVAALIREALAAKPAAAPSPGSRPRPLSAGTGEPDLAAERAGFIVLATRLLAGAVTLVEAGPVPANLRAVDVIFDVSKPLAAAAKDLGADGSPIQRQWERLDARIGLALVRAATTARPPDYVMAESQGILKVLDGLEQQGALPRAMVVEARQAFVARRDQVVAKHDADVRAKAAAEAERQARLAQIPKDPPGVITVRDADGKVIGGLDFRVTPKEQPRTSAPAPYVPPADTSRTCNICNGSGVTYSVTSVSNKSRESCWRCKGKGRLQSYQ